VGFLAARIEHHIARATRHIGVGDAAGGAGDAMQRGDATVAAGDAAQRGDATVAAGDATQRGDATVAAGDAMQRGDATVAAGDAASGGERTVGAANAVRARELVIAQDVATIAGVAVTMLGIKALKILPNIPFAPGHKLVLLTPLYIVAALYTRSRLGAAWTGLTMGLVAFLMGDGKYGVFEVLKHIVPGLLCDLFVLRLAQFTLRSRGRATGPLAWSLAGGAIAAGRFATIFAVTLFVQAPAVAWAFLLPGATVHITFGVLSGYVSHHLVRAVARRPRGKLLDIVSAEGEPAAEAAAAANNDSGGDAITNPIRKEAT